MDCAVNFVVYFIQYIAFVYEGFICDEKSKLAFVISITGLNIRYGNMAIWELFTFYSAL